MARPLRLEFPSEIESQAVDRDSAIITTYTAGAYSQREIAQYFNLHPSTVGVIVGVI